jgi:pimeloyl-ACP methyl ester carboxylesterase
MNAVTRVGTGPELCVFLHGTPGDASVWHAVTARQPASVSSVLLDLPDHGRAPDLADATPEALEGELLRTLGDVGARFTLVGHSYGAYLAARMATRLPERVTRLVLVSGFAEIPAAMSEGFRALAASVRSGDAALAGITAVALERWYGASPSDEERRLVAGIVESTGLARAERLLERVAALTGPSLRVPPYRQPALVLHGSGDAAIPLELGRELATLGARATSEIVETPLHLLPLTHPELVASRVFDQG